MRAGAVASLIVIALGACDTPPPAQRYAIQLNGRTDTGRPLADVEIAANGKPLGVTGPGGGLVVDVRAVEGKLLQIETTCPDGYRAAAPETEVRLRPAVGSGVRNQITVDAECRPRTRRAVVVVRTPRLADVAIRLHGREIGRTDRDGIAHLLLAMAPGTRFQLSLDTSAHPRLRPRDPTSSFTLGDADEIFVFDYQPVADPVKKKRRKKPRAKSPPPGPVKIESLHPRTRRR